ncbi:MAG TPA: sigma-70 family RNA polymerase sigma factor [Actinomycetes bacterium]|nr:sigma-70 family RNA polymerase sigma factor [Actinomycetes bacterium]
MQRSGGHRTRRPDPPVSARAEGAGTAGDEALLAALRGGDEEAFIRLVDGYHASMLRVASAYVPSTAVAEECVQEAWLGVLQQLDRFEGRSSLKTWIFRILVNIAKTRGARERRSVPFSSIEEAQAPAPGMRFTPSGHWLVPPASWEDIPEQRLASAETMAEIGRAIDALPPSQRAVLTLRDVEGWTAAAVGELLGVTDANQRVLLHRARTKVRASLEAYLGRGGARR